MSQVGIYPFQGPITRTHVPVIVFCFCLIFTGSPAIHRQFRLSNTRWLCQRNFSQWRGLCMLAFAKVLEVVTGQFFIWYCIIYQGVPMCHSNTIALICPVWSVKVVSIWFGMWLVCIVVGIKMCSASDQYNKAVGKPDQLIHYNHVSHTVAVVGDLCILLYGWSNDRVLTWWAKWSGVVDLNSSPKPGGGGCNSHSQQ